MIRLVAIPLKLTLALFAGLAILPGTAHADFKICRVKPTLVSTTNVGDVYLSGDVVPAGRLEWKRICNASSAALSTTVDTCRIWISSGLTAQASGKAVMIIYDNGGNPANDDCGALGSWSDFQITYLGMEN